MCGICGFFSKGKNLGKEALEKMNVAQSHRGPDDSGLFLDHGAGLGHRRLSVIDLSQNGHQPMFNEDKSLAVVFNGTIFNFRPLREELLKKGHRFLSQSDTEVLLHLYEEEGEGTPEKLKGQFAFAIWDSRKKQLMLARDRLGIKPVYFARRGDTVIFASEARAVLASGFLPKELDPNGLVSFLECNSVAPPHTIYKGIETLPAGHYLIFDGKRIRVRCYWDMKFRSGKEGPSFEEYKTRLRKSLFDSVDSMLVGDVPVGVFLSGGVDSSVIAGILRELGRTDIETFSIGFPEGEFNELPYARKVAEKNSSRHNEIEITARDLIEELPLIIRAMDQPSGDGLNTYLISKYTKKRVTVALSGLGGDELFFGYHIFQMMHRVLSMTTPLFSLPNGVRRGAFSLAKGMAEAFGLNGRLPEVLNGPDPFSAAYRAMRMVFSGDSIKRSLAGPAPERFPFQELLACYSGARKGLDPREAVSCMELKTYMQNTLLRDSDVMAMAHALEVRFPLLDEDILDLAGEMPPSFKDGKRIFIESIKDLIPPEAHERKKMGFSFPIPLWMKGPLKPWIMKNLSAENVKRAGIFNHHAVAGLLDDFYSRGSADFRLVWSLFLFDLWRRTHIEG
ncbi:MAG: asparagine synthase (glutamine-hydrolyzing) [Nitrospinae bacterium]|nr:asparagine synthase (glutamine-hydrolyzing) [Nitrospinota bacterium]